MKKITLLMMLVAFTLVGYAQVFFDDFSSSDIATNWTISDVDGDGENWEIANGIGWMDGDFADSDSWESALGGLTPDNYMTTTNALNLTSTSGFLDLEYRVGTYQNNGTFIEDFYSVYLTASNDPAVISTETPIYEGFLSDIMTADIDGGANSWAIQSFDLSSYIGQTLYLTFRHHNTFDHNSVLIDDVKIAEPPAFDLRLSTYTMDGGLSTAGYAAGDNAFHIINCDGQAAVQVNAEIDNVGLNDINSFTITASLFDITNGGVFDVDVIDVVNTTVTAGSSYSHSFSSTFDLSGVDEYAFIIAIDDLMMADNDLSNDTLQTYNVFAPASSSMPFTCDFEQAIDLDAVASTFTLDVDNQQNWTWTTENLDAGLTWDVSLYDNDFFTGLDPDLAYDGGFAMHNNDGSDDYVFSQCLSMDMSSTYLLTFYARGDSTPDTNFDVVLSNNNSSAGIIQTLASETAMGPDYVEYKYCFSPAQSGDLNLGFYSYDSTGVYIDALSLIESNGTPVAGFTVAGVDDVNGNVYTEYCDSIVTFSNASTDASEYSWDFDGDGVEDATGEGPHSFAYTGDGSFAPALTVTNCSGTNTTAATVNVVETPLPVVTFDPVTVVDLNVLYNNFTVTPTCGSDVSIDWGDGQVATSNASYTYAAAGDYTVTMTVSNEGGTFSSSETVTVGSVSINEIAFAQAMNVYPNPATETLNVSFELANTVDAEISIFTIAGQVIEVKTFENASNVNATFNVSDLNTGVYMVRVKTEEGISTQRFVVSK